MKTAKEIFGKYKKADRYIEYSEVSILAAIQEGIDTLTITEQKLIDTISEAVAKFQHPSAPQNQIKYLTKSEIASLLNISLPTLTKYMREGKLPFRRIGRRVLFDYDEVNKALNDAM